MAPTIYPLGKEGYGGIERLVTLFLKGLSGYSSSRFRPVAVSVSDSILPLGVERIDVGKASMDFREPLLQATIRPLLATGQYRCYLDFSHSKVVGRMNEYEAQISPIWHDPVMMQPSVPRYNVVALSHWQAGRFREVYRQECHVLDPICGDSDYFCPGGSVGDYVAYIGKLHPSKGCLEAIHACREAKQRLHIVGPVTPGDPPGYVAAVMAACDGVDIVYHGEVTEAKKRVLLQGAKALLYPVSYPLGQGESHSHKMVEAMLCGTPCIAYDQGAMREVIDEGVTGYIIRGGKELTQAISRCETLDRARCRKEAVSRWSYRGVVDTWMPVIESVARGERW